jgi:hypothetical protein
LIFILDSMVILALGEKYFCALSNPYHAIRIHLNENNQ